MIPRAILAVAYAAGRASHARQVKGIPWSSRLGVWRGANNPTHKKLIVTKVEQRKKMDGLNDDGESWRQIGKNGRILFDRPDPTVGCSASGRRKRK
jgi:hypothetical protein